MKRKCARMLYDQVEKLFLFKYLGPVRWTICIQQHTYLYQLADRVKN